MAAESVHVPVKRLLKSGCDIYRVDFDLAVRANGNKICRVPFRLDTASDFTTIPISFAKILNIPFSTTRPVHVRTAAGKAGNPSYLSPMWFSFPGIPQVQFQGMCMFSPYELKQGLFSLTDLLPNFQLRSMKANSVDPDGSVIFQLRHDHRGLTK